MRILIVNFEYPPVGGGASEVHANLAKSFLRHGHTVHTFTTWIKSQPFLEDQAGHSIRRIFSFRRRRDHTSFLVMFWFVILGLVPFLREVRTYRPDVVQCHFLAPCAIFGWCAKKLYGIPYVVSMHGADIPGYLPNLDRLFRLTQPWLLTLLAHARAVTLPSEGAVALAKKSFPHIRLRAINHGVTIAEYEPKENYTYEPSRPVRYITVGRFAYEKYVSLLLRAFLNVYAVHPHVTLTLVGDGGERAALEDMVHGLPPGTVTFAGWVSKEEVKKQLTAADVFVLSSLKETMPIVILQAMAIGLPIVSTRAWGIPEVVIDAIGGYLIPCKDEKALTERLLCIAREPSRWAAMGRANRTRVMQNDWDVIAGRYEELFSLTADK